MIVHIKVSNAIIIVLPHNNYKVLFTKPFRLINHLQKLCDTL